MSAVSEPVQRHRAKPRSSLEGQILGRGRFEILTELGRGGMSEVYRAFDEQHRQEVALKIMAARYVGRPERERRFRNEANYARRVAGHPHIVTVWDDGVLCDCGDRPFMTLELVKGPNLAMELATRRRLPVAQALNWARQIAEGLRALHDAGIVHRDLTPSNALIDKTAGIVKLFDFGLASEIDAPTGPASSRLTLLGEAPGTHGYMAPEQVSMGAPAGAMDVYAFGVVLTEMLAGHNPFSHLDRSEYIQWQQTTLDEAPSIRRWGLSLPEGLEELIDDCLRRDPAERPRDGAELLARLDALVPPPVVTLVPARRSAPVTYRSADLDDVDDEAETVRDVAPFAELPRAWGLLGVLALALVLVGVVVGWWMHTATKANEEAPAVSPGEEEDASNSSAVLVPPGEPKATALATPPVVEETTEPDSPVELEPEPEPKGIEPEPAAEPAEPERKRRVGKRKAAARKPPSPPCPSAAEALADFQGRRWRRVIDHTDSVRCWPDPAERVYLRTRALFELGRFGECAKLAAGAVDVETRRLTKRCTMKKDEESQP
ncbi:MAG: serine/threonine-protein kinase [Myxococcota bacterium]